MLGCFMKPKLKHLPATVQEFHRCSSKKVYSHCVIVIHHVYQFAAVKLVLSRSLLLACRDLCA